MNITDAENLNPITNLQHNSRKKALELSVCYNLPIGTKGFLTRFFPSNNSSKLGSVATIFSNIPQEINNNLKSKDRKGSVGRKSNWEKKCSSSSKGLIDPHSTINLGFWNWAKILTTHSLSPDHEWIFPQMLGGKINFCPKMVHLSQFLPLLISLN